MFFTERGHIDPPPRLDRVKEHYSIAQDALWWWTHHNKPNNGAIYHNMRSSKSRFTYALRSVRRSDKVFFNFFF